ncbi:MAG: hypothetical protein IT287_00855 [Bdellovibrionaceae bacterium]|nr:hypothetical protein [Pseudobdellovibrionaceae bacterium]
MKQNVKNNLILLGTAFMILSLSTFALWPKSKGEQSAVVKKQTHQSHQHKQSKNIKTKKGAKSHAKLIEKKKINRISSSSEVKKTNAKKVFKVKQRLVAANYSVRLRSWEHLGRDGWNHQHEQVETLNDNVGSDPAGAGAFEDAKIAEEISAAGL